MGKHKVKYSRELSSEEKKEIIFFYKKNINNDVNSIAERYGVSFYRVNKVIDQYLNRKIK
jgi:hypothetical protein